MSIRTLLYEDNTDLRGALAALIGGADGFELSGAFDNCMGVVEAAKAARDAGRSYITVASEYLGQDA